MSRFLVWEYSEPFPVASGDEEYVDALGPLVQTEGAAVSVGPTARAGR